MKIGLFKLHSPEFGGSRYEQMVAKALSKEHQVIWYNVRPILSMIGGLIQTYYRVKVLQVASDVDVWIRCDVAVQAMPHNLRPTRNIGLIHHVNPVNSLKDRLRRRLLGDLRVGLAQCDAVVVVANIWKQFLQNQGISNVSIIHNAFNVEAFTHKNEEANQLRFRLGLPDKPLIYVGNSQSEKGAIEVCRALQDMDVVLVTTGLRKTKEVPAVYFSLSYRDYINLIRACCVVITMSTMTEGWNRTAHEAMLCKTPVIGSGSGGMAELLQGGSQMICRRFEDLPSLCERAILNRHAFGEAGYEFASRFTFADFQNKWLKLVNELADPKRG